MKRMKRAEYTNNGEEAFLKDLVILVKEGRVKSPLKFV